LTFPCAGRFMMSTVASRDHPRWTMTSPRCAASAPRVDELGQEVAGR
jgi:hypothetical protein